MMYIWSAGTGSKALQAPDGRMHLDLSSQQGNASLNLHICKRADGTDHILGIGSYAKVCLPSLTLFCLFTFSSTHIQLCAFQ